ncbi:8119_t:CDS:2, partial [Racocetra fulgida]
MLNVKNFGRKTESENKTSQIYENNIYIFNMETYSWVTSFDTYNKISQGTPKNNDEESQNKNDSTKQIILPVVISIIGIICLFCTVLFYKKYRNKNTKSIPTPGDNANYKETCDNE